MKRLAAAVIVLTALVPVSDADAVSDELAAPLSATLSAERVGNATQTAPPEAPAPPPPPTLNVSAKMQAVLDLVNAERSAHGLVPMSFSAELNTSALAHTKRQAADGAIFHTDPRDGSSPGDRISRTGYRFSTWGENVAAGHPTAAAVMQEWMHSRGHCKNILNPEFTEIGVGYVSGGVYYNHFWTQNFARPRGVERPAGTYDPAWC